MKARRDIVALLTARGWSSYRIGKFINRDPSAIRHQRTKSMNHQPKGKKMKSDTRKLLEALRLLYNASLSYLPSDRLTELAEGLGMPGEKRRDMLLNAAQRKALSALVGTKERASPKQKPYTVLLLYPDYIASDYGQETYLAWVTAKDPKAALKKAQRLASSPNQEWVLNTADFYPLIIIEGWHEDLAGASLTTHPAFPKPAALPSPRAGSTPCP